MTDIGPVHRNRTGGVVDLLERDLLHKLQVEGVVGRRDRFVNSIAIAADCISDRGLVVVVVVLHMAVAVVVVNYIAGILLPPHAVTIAAGAWIETCPALRSWANRVANPGFRTVHVHSRGKALLLREPATVVVSNQSPTVGRGSDLSSWSRAQEPRVVECAMLFSFYYSQCGASKQQERVDGH